MSDIKPRYDNDGVPWCDRCCPKLQDQQCYCGEIHREECAIDKRTNPSEEVCPHAVKEIAEYKLRYPPDYIEKLQHLGRVVIHEICVLDTRVKDLEKDRKDLEKDRARLFDLLNWLTHLVNGVGKEGGPPSSDEWDDCEAQCRAAIDEAMGDDDD